MSNHDHLEIALGDKVKVKLKGNAKKKKNENIGTVLFYGAVESHKGTWFGISFDESIGKNDGTYKKRKYFKCKAKHGCFVQHNQIIKIISQSSQKHYTHYNASITLPGYGYGKVRFAGIAPFNPGIWYGIELDTALDTDAIHSTDTDTVDGTVSGIRYFECAAGYALFRRQEDLFAILSGKKPSLNDIVIQKNIKPSLTEKKRNHSTTEPHTNKGNKKEKGNKKHKGVKMKRSESEPPWGEIPITLPSIEDLSNISNSEHDEEIKDNQQNDHSNETKEDEHQYDYDLKPIPNDPFDEMDAEVEVDERTVKKKKKKKAMQHLANSLLIVESDTSDIADIEDSAAAEPKEKIVKHIGFTKSKSVPPPRNDSTPRSIYSNNNVSAYIDHLQDVATGASSPVTKTYTRPHSKSIKKLKHAFLDACSDTDHKHNKGKTTGSEVDKAKKLKVNVSKDKENLKELEPMWKQHGTPVKFGDLSLEYSTSSPTLDDLALDDTPIPSMNSSKSMPPNSNKVSQIKPIDVSQSTRGSIIGDHRDRALTFPTMALNTDNATKISAATPHQQKFKVVVMGQSRVGKTSIIRRFVKDKFLSSYKMTLGAAQWHFKCEVPIDLIEEIETDNNMLRSMTSFLDQVQEENEDIKQEEPGPLFATSIDPFDEEDKLAEFGDSYDYGTDGDDYKLSNMEKQIDTDYLSGFNLSQENSGHNGSRSITDYGQFTIPLIETVKDTRKVSMKLQITLDIVDMGFHPTEDELFDDINAIILVIDFSKKSSINDAIDKYEMFCKNSLYFDSKRARRKSRRSRARSHSNPRGSMLNPEDVEREYIPLIVAVNKCENKRQFKKKELKKIISNRLQPIIDEHFPETKEENDNKDDNKDDDDDDDTDDEQQRGKRRPRNFANTTLLQPPNLSFIYNESDNTGSDSEYETDDDEQYEDDNDEDKRNLLDVNVASVRRVSDPGDPFNTPRNQIKKKRKTKSSRRRKKVRDQNDVRYIDIIQCSAKTGKNIEKLFGTCIKKTIPSKLTKSVKHKRNKTTAHVTAPIWLRQVVAEFEKDTNNENHPFWDHSPAVSDVDDNFTFLGDL